MLRRLLSSAQRRAQRFVQHRRLRDFYQPLIPEGALCFDIGANEGHWTRAFLMLGATVVAVEPNPEVARRFLDPLRITVERVAVGPKEGTAALHLAEEATTVAHIGTHWSQGRFSNLTWSREMSVPMTTLDVLVAKHGVPHMCKIDVEGYEPDVLAGLSHPLPLISFEVTAEFMNLARASCEHIRRLGEYEANIVIGDNTNFVLDTWRSLAEVESTVHRMAEADPLFVGDMFVRHL